MVRLAVEQARLQFGDCPITGLSAVTGNVTRRRAVFIVRAFVVGVTVLVGARCARIFVAAQPRGALLVEKATFTFKSRLAAPLLALPCDAIETPMAGLNPLFLVARFSFLALLSASSGVTPCIKPARIRLGTFRADRQ